LEHGEGTVFGEIRLGEGVGWRELNTWLLLKLNVGGVLKSVTLAYQADCRKAEGILQEEGQ
jgi:hypothetical protein